MTMVSWLIDTSLRASAPAQFSDVHRERLEASRWPPLTMRHATKIVSLLARPLPTEDDGKQQCREE